MKIYQYEFDQPFKEGGMGRIYLGRHVFLGEEVIIKELIISGSEAQKQFLEEARILYSNNGEPVRHQSIPAVKDYFVHKGNCFLVMDYIKGKSMQDFLDLEKIFDEDTVCWVTDRVLAGLAFLHRFGIIHRDIKPANIIVKLDIHRAWLVDFGIARKKITALREEIGKVSYTRYFASPEQYRGEVCGPPSDIYSMGATMYFALTGVLPPEASTLKSDGDLKPVNEIDPSIHTQLAAIISKAMRSNPNNRFKNAGEMKELCDKVRMTYINPNWQPPSV